MALFRFLHVSDLHIGASPEKIGLLPLARSGFRISGHSGAASVSSHNQAMLEGLALLVWRESKFLDGVLITGDLATTGRLADVRAAYDFVNEPRSNSVPYLSNARKPTLNNSANFDVYLVPGNHDRFGGKRLLPASDNFDKVFASSNRANWPVGQSAYKLGVMEKDGVALGFVGADLTLRTASDIDFKNPAQVWGAGRVYQDVIDKMSSITEELRDNAGTRPIIVVWLVHFPPKFPEVASSLALLDEDLLVNAAHANNVGLLLAGHTHEEKHYPISPSLQVYCGATTTEHRLPGSSEPRGVHFLEFTVSPNGDCAVAKKTLTWSNRTSYWT
jgi:DNA repair exonuclease SbcCD nuclease subunit